MRERDLHVPVPGGDQRRPRGAIVLVGHGRRRPERRNVQAQRHLEVLGRRPEGLVLGSVVGGRLGGTGRDHRADEAEPASARQLRNRAGNVLDVNRGDPLQPLRIVPAELGEPVVVARKDRRQQLAVGDLIEREPLRRIKHGSPHAVEVVVGQEFLGVVRPLPHVGEVTRRLELLGTIEPLAGLRAALEGVGADAVHEPPVSVRVADDARGASAILRGQPPVPGVGGLDHVRIRRDDPGVRHRAPP